MREVLILAVHLLVTIAKLLRPGGVRAVAAESLLLKHQLLISNRSRQRAPISRPSIASSAVLRNYSITTRLDAALLIQGKFPAD